MAELSHAEAVKLGLEPAGAGALSDEQSRLLGLEGEPGHPGPNPYAGGPYAHQPTEPPDEQGTPWDGAKEWANKAAVGAGPQVEGAMGAIANSLTQGFQDKPTSDLDAYRFVRDEGKKEHDRAAKTTFGKLGGTAGMVSTPMPFGKVGPGASTLDRAYSGALTAGGVGLVSGAAQSEGDLTKGEFGKVLKDSLVSGAGAVPIGMTFGAVSRAPAAAGEAAQVGAKKLALGSLAMTPSERAALAASGKGNAAADALVGVGGKPGLLGFSRGGTAEHVAHGLDSAGRDIGDIKNAIDARKGGATVLPDVLADDTEAAARAHGRANTPEEAGTPEAAAVMRDLLARAERQRNFGGGKAMSLADAEATFKSPLNDAARKVKSSTTEPPASALARKLARDAAAGSNERAAEAGLSVLEPSLAGKYGPAKERYGVAKELARILEKREPEAFAKRSLEPVSLPTVDLDVGANSGGISGGVRGFAGRQLSNIAAPAAAKGLNAAGRVLESAPTGGATAGQIIPYLRLLEEQKDGGE